MKNTNIDEIILNKPKSNFNFGWKKGLTKNDHAGIAAQAEKMSGDNNPTRKPKVEKPHIDDSKSMKCVICNDFEHSNLKAFASHLQAKHGLKSQDYTVRFILKLSKPPTCAYDGCNNIPRYVSFMFKKYCKEHSSVASSEGGKIGGTIKTQWNKGLTKETDERIKVQAERQTGENNQFYGKRHSEETKLKWKQNKALTEQEYNERTQAIINNFVVVTTYKDYYSRQNQYLDVICSLCALPAKRTLQALERQSKCYKCFPLSTNSREETEIKDFIQSLNVNCIFNDRSTIKPKELDIHCPNQKVAIEYDSLYFHADNGMSDVTPDRHLFKTKECLKHGIKLLHIFSDEWLFKKDIVKSIIKVKLGVVQNKIFARQTTIKEVDKTIAKQFFDQNHIAGNTKSNVYFGLYDNNNLVMCIGLRTPLHKVKSQDVMEVSRLATVQDTIVVGGLSKLIERCKQWCKENDYNKIMTYADRRFGEGKSYEQCGFEFIKSTELDYWYTDYCIRYNRFKFRAQNGIPEKKIADEAGVVRIYGCGSNLYEMKIIKE